LGKTTLACIIAEELQVPITTTSGPVLQKKLDLTGILSNIRARQVFFIDEIHRLMPDVEEMLYSALEDFRVDILVGAGPGARTHSLPMPRFTAIGATTRQGLISAPLRGRFGLVLRLDPYAVDELTVIVQRSARLLTVGIDDDAAEELARRCRGTPRIANRLLRRVRDYAQVRADGRITQAVAQTALNLLEVDRFGLDEIDQKIMLTILEKYRGGRLNFGRSRYHRGSLRTLLDPTGLSQSHSARAGGHRRGLRLFSYSAALSRRSSRPLLKMWGRPPGLRGSSRTRS
jgi:Holliday junction DNA helicase RuvB